ncbi:UDP-N-acetylglucosamine--undecaprenyl-phosphate N-acetylglucosaminephosphotransferase [Vibrio metschnikovii]|nr:UDP-N-acetylglucosamine--undecaprenyl-phosphate N-acetylglucosaminephosphotransferase [Vibrio metschnikovii]
MHLQLLVLFCLSFFSLLCLRKLAKQFGLVDLPNQRKLHEGPVPLVGGLAITIVLTLFLLFNPSLMVNSRWFIVSIAILSVVGALDDKFDLSVVVRLAVQVCLSMVMIHLAGLELLYLGNIWGFGVIELGWLGKILTIVAVIAAINAFNIVDGIDGLLGGLSMVTFGALALVLLVDGQFDFAYFCLAMMAIMLPYIFMNLGILGRQRKVFMGDAGSMMIGFTVIWILLNISQASTQPLLRPVTALWLIAIPLMDMAAVMIRRVRQGRSPFKPDREHLHHICQRLGLSSRQTLCFICGMASVLAGFGLCGELMQLSEAIMFYLFMLLFFTYLITLSYIWRITSFIRKHFGKQDVNIVEQNQPLV